MPALQQGGAAERPLSGEKLGAEGRDKDQTESHSPAGPGGSQGGSVFSRLESLNGVQRDDLTSTSVSGVSVSWVWSRAPKALGATEAHGWAPGSPLPSTHRDLGSRSLGSARRGVGAPPVPLTLDLSNPAVTLWPEPAPWVGAGAEGALGGRCGLCAAPQSPLAFLPASHGDTLT